MGGKAFDDTKPVARDRIIPIIEWYLKALGGFRFTTLGSTGKKDMSGDIDLAVQSINGFTFDFGALSGFAHEAALRVMVLKLEKILGVDNVKPNIRFSQIYTRWHDPQGGDPVQVDFMLGDMALLAFTHWSPEPHTSQYSGAHRTEYLKAVAKSLSRVESVDGRVVARVGYTLHHDRGLEYSPRWCKPRQDGEGYTVKMVKVSDADIELFEATFPLLVSKKESHGFTTDPRIICERLFDTGVTPDMVNSYEQIADLVKNSHHLYINRDLIWQLYVERLVEIKQPIPKRFV